MANAIPPFFLGDAVRVDLQTRGPSSRFGTYCKRLEGRRLPGIALATTGLWRPLGNFECGGSTPLSSGEAWLAGASDCCKFMARQGLALPRKLASGTVLKVLRSVSGWASAFLRSRLRKALARRIGPFSPRRQDPHPAPRAPLPKGDPHTRLPLGKGPLLGGVPEGRGGSCSV